tara:strand:+ start:24 stop:224 length:201 start_codon:yes stop_codon:yes gene_type:complete
MYKYKTKQLLSKEKKLDKQIKKLTNKVMPIFFRLKRLEKKHKETTNQIDNIVVNATDKQVQGINKI